MARQPKKIKNTPSGRRALAGARSGKGGILNPDGSKSSIRTATFGVTTPDGKKRTMIVPTVVAGPGGAMHRLTPDQALQRARATGDFALVKRQSTADRRSKKFSRRLGQISQRQGK
jgi:hypothetical protein